MLDLNNIYTEHTAGPISAGKLGINEGEIIGYSTPSGGGHQKGGAIGDAEIEEPNQPPPIKDIIGTMRWRMRMANRKR